MGFVTGGGLSAPARHRIVEWQPDMQFLAKITALVLAGSALLAAGDRASKREYSFASGQKRYLKLETEGSAPRHARLGQIYSLRFQVKPLLPYGEATERPRVRLSLYSPDGDRTRAWVTAGPDGAYEFTFQPCEAGIHHFAFESGPGRWVLAQVPMFTVTVDQRPAEAP